jgi:hypothetical protein
MSIVTKDCKRARRQVCIKTSSMKWMKERAHRVHRRVNKILLHIMEEPEMNDCPRLTGHDIS